jgi:hypothetical protein
MSIRLNLDDSLIQVAPTLDDIEAVLIVQTRRVKMADGKVRKVSSQAGRKVQTGLPQIDGAQGAFETRIGVNDAKGQPEYEARSAHRAGGVGPVFLETHRRVKFAFRWYGEDNRYLELRVQVFPSAEIVANRGMSTLGTESGYNFVGALQSDHWAEIHYDNHAHVGLSMKVHDDRNFAKWVDVKPTVPPNLKTRFDRLNDDD